MSFCTANGRAVVEGRITLPRVGLWTADLLVEEGTALTGKVSIKAPGLALAGTVTRGGVFEQKTRARVVAGAGGLGKDLPAKGYVGVTLRSPVQDICNETGEKLSDTVDSTLLTQHLGNWARVATKGGHALTRLCEAAGPDVVWRLLPDGTVWLGKETWPTSTQPQEPTLEDDHVRNRMLYGSTNLVLLPGTRYRARKVDAVIHTIGEVTRTEAVFA